MANEQKPTWSLEESRNIDFDNYKHIVNASEKRGDYERENKPFLYPGPLAISINAGDNRISQKMQRGFMRSIIMGGDVAGALKAQKGPGNLRLNFQFNPEYIERRVSQSPGAVNPLLQNPQNLTQAVPGTAQFNFTMTFNREHEVAKGETLYFGGLGGEDTNFAGDFSPEVLENALKDPGKVGVMHDLSIFDKIIGQGISNELVNIITAYTRQQTIASNNAATENTEDDNDTVTPFNEDSFIASINKNFGNSAFLNPMPVRIVFSDLFMVEGLVVGSAVAFQKFSQKMIPTICQVNCEVYALYVGFAKRKAFLTDNLTSWAAKTATDATKTAEDTALAKKQMASRAKKVWFVMNSSDTVGAAVDKNNLEVPNYNSLSMRVVKPTITNIYYPGNVSNDTDRFVTVPQWFNAFSGNSFYPTASANITSSYISGYTSDQVENKSSKTGKLPLHVFIEYEKLDGQTDAIDAEFEINVKLLDKSTNKTKDISAQADGKWEKKNWTDYGIYKKGSDKSKSEIYSRVIWLDPLNVEIKEAIKSDATCVFKITITMRQTIPGISSQVVLTFDTIDWPFSPNAPLFYKASANTDNNKTLVKPTNLTVRGPSGAAVDAPVR